MALVSRVAPVVGSGGWWPPAIDRKDEMLKVTTTCHFATVYWLFEEVHDRPFTFSEFMDRVGDPTTFVRDLLPTAVLLQQSYRIQAEAGLKVKATDGAAQAGWVVMFAESKINPGHSCIALTTSRIGGCNQTDCFTNAGQERGYSEHDTVDIPWQTKHRTVRGRCEYTLCAGPEATAVAAMRAKTTFTT